MKSLKYCYKENFIFNSFLGAVFFSMSPPFVVSFLRPDGSYIDILFFFVSYVLLILVAYVTCRNNRYKVSEVGIVKIDFFEREKVLLHWSESLQVKKYSNPFYGAGLLLSTSRSNFHFPMTLSNFDFFLDVVKKKVQWVEPFKRKDLRNEVLSMIKYLLFILFFFSVITYLLPDG